VTFQNSIYKTVNQWQNLIEDLQSPFYTKLNDLYGKDRTLKTNFARMCSVALDKFGESFGYNRDVMLVRATGRVNLVGMHIDHRGGSVNPIAIKDMLFVVQRRDDDLVLLKNVEPAEFTDEQFRIRDCLPAHKIKDWDHFCHDEFEKRKADRSVTWSSYIRAAVLYLQHLYTKNDGTFSPALKGMNIMAYGNIPRAAGLSSSSSLVLITAEAVLAVNKLRMAPMDLVEHCGYAEWYVGTRGGCGDHAAIKFGRANTILHMTSFPLTVDTAPFPAGYKVALANSLVEAKKQTGARSAYNDRIASYTFGFMLIRKNFPQYTAKLRYLRDVNPAVLGVDQCEIYRMIKSIPESVNRAGILKLLPEHEQQIQQIFRSHDEPKGGYKLRQICLYGVAECIRADMVGEVLKAGDVKRFGELMNASHDGDRVTEPTKIVNGKRVPIDNSYPDERIDSLIKDLQSSETERMERALLWRQGGGYNVSVPEMDMLVDIALDSPGVVGAGLVGAGMGGSIAAVVEEKHAQELIEKWSEKYYRPRNLPIEAEIVSPVAGAGVLDL